MIYAYLRVSTDKQCTENQRFEINQFAKERNITIDGWVEEIVSGSNKIKNRKLGKLFRVVKKGDWIITSELSRVGRNLMYIMSFLHQCMEREAVVFTIKERYELGNNLNSKILAFAFSLSAEIERNLISQRTREALARKKLEGVKLGRPKGRKSSYYKLSGKEKHIIRLLNDKHSLGEICNKLGVCRNTLRIFMEYIYEINPDYLPSKFRN
ncbi:MAG: master DNA invertase Mpi family serine-type recombinase [Tannerellaceae bacterium]|jgi:DNA invertase Pin-like site-specific DNA recombinase|nr:master DNA invertase Mpi family serine-type recombinase [Tannerellaceae bacterium]